MYICQLRIGDGFAFVHDPNCADYRNMTVSYLGEGMAAIKGEHRIVDKEKVTKWLPLGVNYTVSLQTDVIRMTGANGQPAVKRGRGRPKGSKNQNSIKKLVLKKKI